MHVNDKYQQEEEEARSILLHESPTREKEREQNRS